MICPFVVSRSPSSFIFVLCFFFFSLNSLSNENKDPDVCMFEDIKGYAIALCSSKYNHGCIEMNEIIILTMIIYYICIYMILKTIYICNLEK